MIIISDLLGFLDRLATQVPAAACASNPCPYILMDVIVLCRALRKFDVRLSHIHPEDQLAIEEIMMMRAERLERTKILA